MKQEIFIEQPITMEATGDYHAFGAFVSSIAALPRIVTMHDFVVEAALVNKDSKSDIPVLNYSIKAKTYRYMGAVENAEHPENNASASVAPVSSIANTQSK
ncbi:Pilus assembly protein, PilO [compost metagenome]